MPAPQQDEDHDGDEVVTLNDGDRSEGAAEDNGFHAVLGPHLAAGLRQQGLRRCRVGAQLGTRVFNASFEAYLNQSQSGHPIRTPAFDVAAFKDDAAPRGFVHAREQVEKRVFS